MTKSSRAIAALLFACTGALSAEANEHDSIPLLLMDVNIQIEATEGINDMYNFDFVRADGQFRWLKQKYSWHPLPYFMLGLSQWWRMVPDVSNEQYDETFFAYMDSALIASRNIFDKGSKVEGGFFLSATYAFIGRLHAERKKWRKAAAAGRNALKYLEYCRDKGEYGDEILFGDALYNYYSVWIPENYPLLKPIMIFFKNGNKEEGIKLLKQVANNAFFTRTEAQYFLMKILANEEDKPEDALPVAKYLSETFPNNPYFHRYYARLLYTMGRHREAEQTALSILDKIERGFVGYENHAGRYASFFLGEIYRRRKQHDKAKRCYEQAVEFGLKANAQKMGYHHYSLLNLGKIAFQDGDRKTAKQYFKTVKKLTKSKDSAHKLANRYLREMKQI